LFSTPFGKKLVEWGQGEQLLAIVIETVLAVGWRS